MELTEEPSVSVATHCPYCSLQCAMSLQQLPDGKLHIDARDFPTNRGGLCRKGWTSTELLRVEDRLTSPMLRDPEDRLLKPVSWTQALEFLGGQIQQLQKQSGRDTIALFGSGGLTNEKVYALGKLARSVLRTRYIDYNGRFCMAAGATANRRIFGIDRGLPFPIEDIGKADLLILAGSNIADTMPPAAQHLDDLQSHGKLIVIDPRKTSTAARADLYLQPRPGSDIALYHGILHLLIQNQQLDTDFIRTKTIDFSKVKHITAQYWPDQVERLTGVPVKQLHLAADMLAATQRIIALSGRGIEQQQQGVDNDLGLINLILARGAAGKPYSGFGIVTGQGNGQGGREHGQKADQLPGYRELVDPLARAHMAEVWQMSADDLPQPGVSATEMFEQFGQDIRALLIFGANPVISAPQTDHFLEQLRKLDLLVVADSFLSETAALADLVLPVTQWAEEIGTMTNVEGRVILRQAATSAPPGVKSDLQVMAALAQQLDYQGTFADDPEEVFSELGQATVGAIADYSGINYFRLRTESGIFWPCPNTSHPGTPRLFTDGFPTPNGRLAFSPVVPYSPSEQPDERYPFYLTTGRLPLHYQTGVQTRRVPELYTNEPDAPVIMHPAMAKNYHIQEKDPVQVTTPYGIGEFIARLSADIRMDTLFVPMHWGGSACANNLTGNKVDRDAKIPAFKYVIAKVTKVSTINNGNDLTPKH